MKMPDSMDECFYFTNRKVDNGKVIAWVRKPDCPKCKKAKMGKPVDDKTGGVKIRAKEYVCPACKYTVSKEEFEPTCTMEIIYTCPKCGNKGESTTPYARKSFMGVKAYLFTCQKCGEKIPITKKLKKVKGKVEKDDEDDE